MALYKNLRCKHRGIVLCMRVIKCKLAAEIFMILKDREVQIIIMLTP